MELCSVDGNLSRIAGAVACFQSSVIAGGGLLFLQDAVVPPTQYVHSGVPGEDAEGSFKIEN